MIANEQDGSSLVSSPFDEQIELQKRAIELLRLSDSSYLGCRDEEAGILREFIDSSAKNGVGGSIFVFGLSGTGKSTTVNHVIKKYKEENPDMCAVSVTGSGFSSWRDVVDTLVKRIVAKPTKNKIVPKYRVVQDVMHYKRVIAALASLFTSASKYTVCVMDEVDYLCTFMKRKDDKQNHNWMLQAIFKAANAPGSKVLFVAISNNLELATLITEKLCRILLFKPYNEKQMISLVKGKLQQLDKAYTSVINDTAILLLVRRVANTSGDLRACLDTFTRAIANSMSQLEGVMASVSSVSTTYSLTDTPESSPNRFVEDSSTPKRTFSDMADGSFELENYQVGYKEVGSLTPTLTLNKIALLKQKIQPLPFMQLLTLLALSKASIDQNDNVVSLNNIKRSLLHFADIMVMDNVDVEDFCASEFKDTIDIFKELNIASTLNEKRFDGDDVLEEEKVVLAVDGETLAQVVLPISPAFVGLNLEFPVEDDCGYQYSKISKGFNIRTSSKRNRKKQW
ncbi:hypothetical protein X943_002494 [Babesia divergens]|uniref:AAA+ ATPase domain-containing protein n=1 Tax=Babesia divergens TaxID=32595 RepID=A0AAD9LIA2_BABDI|nr:hypothetical protein X943_002494 [Babesia divergens]